jgi:hypothetical protein
MGAGYHRRSNMFYMICEDVRHHLLDAQRGRLALDLRAQIDAHVETCRPCLREEAAEQLLTETLEGRLPQYAASLALKRWLVVEWPGQIAPAPSVRERWRRPTRPGTAPRRL